MSSTAVKRPRGLAGLATRVPLRALLVGTMLLLVLTGLVVSAAAVTVTMREQLTERVDDQLREAAGGWAHHGPRPPEAVGAPTRAPLPSGTTVRRSDADKPSTRRPPSQFFVEIRSADGSSQFVVNDFPTAPVVEPGIEVGRPRTVPSAGDGGDWRVLAVRTEDGDVVVLGLPLDTAVDRTVTQLLVVQTGVGAGVLLLIGVAGWYLIRRALQPLHDVGETAREIAAGDLSRRLPERAPGTEVGDLSRSFNEMVTRIQSAFAEAEHSEAGARQSEAAARRSEDRMRRFVADASHELRTPLTSIRGFSELYRRGMMPDADQAVGRIESEAGRMSALVEDLLTLARLDAERPLDRQPVDLASVASEAVTACRAIDPRRSISLSLDAVPVVSGDAGRIRQVVSNLLVNAIRHAGPDARVWVEVGQDDDGAVLRVRDDGRGMGPEEAARVFERFHRADASRTRGDGGGSGLGLSIVEGIVRAHGGRVELDTAPGEGATFSVYL